MIGGSASSKDIFATCSVCQQRNTFRQLPPSVTESGREDARLFCNTCNTITMQRFAAGSIPQRQRAPQQTAEVNDEMLWGRFERSVQDSGMRMADVFRCDEPTRRAVVERLGFRPEVERLLSLIRDRHPQNLLNALNAATPPPSTATPSNAPPSPAPPPSAAPQASQHQAYFPMSSLGAAHAPQMYGSGDPSASPLRGISYVNDAIIARCSVYPELPAEFWCCTCNVLVSSRCHVVGPHKDHPFITLRVAAEGHVRDLSAWGERCRSQLGITESIIANLQHAAGMVQQSRQTQMEQLESQCAALIEDIMRWKDQLRQDIHTHVDTQVASVQFASLQAQKMHDLYTGQLRTCEPLLSLVPTPETQDKVAEDWSLRILDFVSKLKLLNVEPVPLPKIFLPEIKSVCTPATPLELIKQISVPLGVRLPDLIDPGYFNFPHPTSTSRIPFTLQPPPDSKSKGVLIYSGRTLTRAQDVLPSQTLVSASQVFYSGTTTWEVHIDRLGAGPGRILAGIVIQGSDGEGIVWDGHRIVGPNEGECRVVDERYVLRPGTVLRFVLELDPPQHFLSCFFDRDGVARIPLPPTGSGWVPAFSVFGPQDQITVVPTSSTNRLANANQQYQQTTAKKEELASVTKMKEQEHMISSLQQQLQSLTMRLDAEQFRATVLESNNLRVSTATPSNVNAGQNHGGNVPYHYDSYSTPIGANGAGAGTPPPSHSYRPPSASASGAPSPIISATTGQYPPSSSTPSSSQAGAQLGRTMYATPPPVAVRATPPPSGVVTSPPPAATPAAAAGDSGYSSELQSLLRFVGEIR